VLFIAANILPDDLYTVYKKNGDDFITDELAPISLTELVSDTLRSGWKIKNQRTSEEAVIPDFKTTGMRTPELDRIELNNNDTLLSIRIIVKEDVDDPTFILYDEGGNVLAEGFEEVAEVAVVPGQVIPAGYTVQYTGGSGVLTLPQISIPETTTTTTSTTIAPTE